VQQIIPKSEPKVTRVSNSLIKGDSISKEGGVKECQKLVYLNPNITPVGANLYR